MQVAISTLITSYLNLTPKTCLDLIDIPEIKSAISSDRDLVARTLSSLYYSGKVKRKPVPPIPNSSVKFGYYIGDNKMEEELPVKEVTDQSEVVESGKKITLEKNKKNIRVPDKKSGIKTKGSISLKTKSFPNIKIEENRIIIELDNSILSILIEE